MHIFFCAALHLVFPGICAACYLVMLFHITVAIAGMGIPPKELVRYIHLNPLRANIVENLAKLDSYRYCGHSVLMGKVKNDWQDRDYVLKWFGTKEGEAKLNEDSPPQAAEYLISNDFFYIRRKRRGIKPVLRNKLRKKKEFYYLCRKEEENG